MSSTWRRFSWFSSSVIFFTCSLYTSSSGLKVWPECCSKKKIHCTLHSYENLEVLKIFLYFLLVLSTVYPKGVTYCPSPQGTLVTDTLLTGPAVHTQLLLVVLTSTEQNTSHDYPIHCIIKFCLPLLISLMNNMIHINLWLIYFHISWQCYLHTCLYPSPLSLGWGYNPSVYPAGLWPPLPSDSSLVHGYGEMLWSIKHS